jgi:hypothetical protein
LQFFLFFNFFVRKAYAFESFKWGNILKNFVSFSFRTSKFKNDISYIKYKFSHIFGKVCKWLNIYCSNIKIITFKKIKTMFIWIILNNLKWTYRECNFWQYWHIQLCIHPIIVWQQKELFISNSSCLHAINTLSCLTKKTFTSILLE